MRSRVPAVGITDHGHYCLAYTLSILYLVDSDDLPSYSQVQLQLIIAYLYSTLYASM